MNVYENIPTIVLEAVRSLYRESYVDVTSAVSTRFWDAVDTRILLADARLLLTQFSLVLSVVFVAFIVFVALQRRALKSPPADAAVPTGAGEPAAVPAGPLRDRWNTVLAHLDSPREADWKLAVIEADKLIDDALARAGYPGATFGDRLSNISPGTLVSLDGIWWAHKVRNRLAHEVDYFLRYTEARQAVGYFEAALAELQLI